jgi:hypothetical protein
MKRYEIRTINQLRKIPADKRPEMLRDLAAWLEFSDQPLAIVDVESRTGNACRVKPVFIWIDDGLSGLTEVSVGGATYKRTAAGVFE